MTYPPIPMIHFILNWISLGLYFLMSRKHDVQIAREIKERRKERKSWECLLFFFVPLVLSSIFLPHFCTISLKDLAYLLNIQPVPLCVTSTLPRPFFPYNQSWSAEHRLSSNHKPVRRIYNTAPHLSSLVTARGCRPNEPPVINNHTMHLFFSKIQVSCQISRNNYRIILDTRCRREKRLLDLTSTKFIFIFFIPFMYSTIQFTMGVWVCGTKADHNIVYIYIYIFFYCK